MLFVTRVVVGDRSRVLVTRQGRFATILDPGVHMLFGMGIETETYSIEEPYFDSTWANYMYAERPTLVRQLFEVVETGAGDVAMVYRDGRLERVQGPDERTLVWKTGAPFHVEIVKASEAPLAAKELVAPLMKLGRSAKASFALVPDGHAGIFSLDGKYVEMLSPGLYAMWNVNGSPAVDAVDLRLQTLEIGGQEILTADKVSIRVNVWAEYQVIDPLKARQTVKNPTEHLYKIVQMALRQTLAKRTLDEVLAARTDVDADVAESVRTEAAGFGLRVGGIGVKDIIPPGEVREILNQVVAAEKQAQANLIRRREETAATRSLLNTARLMSENPILVRLKELETLEKVAEKVEKIHVYGGLDGLVQNLVSMRES
jgi:regulator of protease activity HflC (stomatin/prohibitin superfamily)